MFADENRDGLPDEEESGIAGVAVSVVHPETGQVGPTVVSDWAGRANLPLAWHPTDDAALTLGTPVSLAVYGPALDGTRLPARATSYLSVASSGCAVVGETHCLLTGALVVDGVEEDDLFLVPLVIDDGDDDDGDDDDDDDSSSSSSSSSSSFVSPL